MVKKLIKYDFKAFGKIMFPAYLVLLGVAALYRFVSIFESDTTYYNIFNVSAISIVVISVIVCAVMTVIVSIVRFYKGLYTAEGYLSFTLPVTPSAHIWSKLIVSLIFDALTAVVSFLVLAITTAGELFVEIIKAALYQLKDVFVKIGGQSPLYVIEIILLTIVAAATAHLLMFMCISIGQIAKKHKILAALGIYFAIYVVKQILGTVFLASGVTSNFFMDVTEFISKHTHSFFHLFFCGLIVLEALFGALYFIITRLMMKKHLNLE